MYVVNQLFSSSVAHGIKSISGLDHIQLICCGTSYNHFSYFFIHYCHSFDIASVHSIDFSSQYNSSKYSCNMYRMTSDSVYSYPSLFWTKSFSIIASCMFSRSTPLDCSTCTAPQLWCNMSFVLNNVVSVHAS